MAIRPPRDQELHDMVTNALKSLYTKKDLGAVQASTDVKPPEIKGVRPSLVVKMGYPLIFKVETEESVNEVEAMEWKTFVENAGAFHLVVPSPMRDQAVLLIQKHKIAKVKISTYVIQDNKLKFGNLP